MGSMLSKYCNGIIINYPRHKYRLQPPNDIIWREIEQIKNSYIVLIKHFITTTGKIRFDPKVIRELKRNNNKIIYIVVDAIAKNEKLFRQEINKYANLYDLVLFGSNYQRDVFKDIVPSKVLYHLWDELLQPNKSKDFNMCYIGSTLPWKNYMLKCLDIDIMEVTKHGEMKYEKIRDYNCHYSVREKNNQSWKYGVTSKIATAAATHSNILCSKDRCFIEVLPEYDYYISKIEEIPDMMEKMKKEFNTPPWYKNIERIKQLKERLSPTTIGKDFKNFINFLS